MRRVLNLALHDAGGCVPQALRHLVASHHVADCGAAWLADLHRRGPHAVAVHHASSSCRIPVWAGRDAETVFDCTSRSLRARCQVCEFSALRAALSRSRVPEASLIGRAHGWRAQKRAGISAGLVNGVVEAEWIGRALDCIAWVLELTLGHTGCSSEQAHAGQGITVRWSQGFAAIAANRELWIPLARGIRAALRLRRVLDRAAIDARRPCPLAADVRCARALRGVLRATVVADTVCGVPRARRQNVAGELCEGTSFASWIALAVRQIPVAQWILSTRVFNGDRVAAGKAQASRWVPCAISVGYAR